MPGGIVTVADAGDSLTSDIQGGVDYGLDTCWYNPTAELRPGELKITYEIRHLREMLIVIFSAMVVAVKNHLGEILGGSMTANVEDKKV